MDNKNLIQYWINSADRDYKTMEIMFENKRNTWCLFLGHLIIEKLLKGLYARNNPQNPIAPKTHNLILLSKKSNLEVPENIKEKIQVINTFNIAARYDDYKESFYKKCTDKYTKEQVKNIKEVEKWLKEQLVKIF